ncbi:MAG: CDP-alcohol phosphatidyltransferase family protein [Bacillota bacterium]|nr:CDP-alcohol phosphatidyltransferase family protein [Bacillota bacterium]
MTLATWLTLLRFALIPAFVAAFFAPPAHQRLYAAGILALAGLTDVLDGYLARARREESLTGRLLDPLADKLVVLTGVGLLVWAGRLRAWIAWALLVKEALLIGGAFVFYLLRREMLPATWVGKTAAVLFYAGLFLGILAPHASRTSELVILAGLAFSVAAGLGYTRRAVRTAKGDEP